jgi:threonine dehydratase
LDENKIIRQEEVKIAYKRIKDFVIKTPMVQSETLNSLLKHNIYFKAEPFQKTGSFKIRGAFNCLLAYKEKHGSLPKRVVAFSTGNHGQGLAFACKKFGIQNVTIYMTKNASKLKMQAIKFYGGKISIHKTRDEIYKIIEKEVKKGAYNVPTSDNDMVIAGQATATYEALKEKIQFDVIFCPCGSGGLISGTYITSKLFEKKPKIFGVEPKLANKISRSLKKNKIVRFDKEVVTTIADGARTPFISPRIFEYVKKIDGIEEVTENEIIYWNQWLIHLLKLNIEPTSAMAMAGCFNWLKKQKKKQNILVILSGGNSSTETQKKIFEKNFLTKPPKL